MAQKKTTPRKSVAAAKPPARKAAAAKKPAAPAKKAPAKKAQAAKPAARAAAKKPAQKAAAKPTPKPAPTKIAAKKPAAKAAAKPAAKKVAAKKPAPKKAAAKGAPPAKASAKQAPAKVVGKKAPAKAASKKAAPRKRAAAPAPIAPAPVAPPEREHVDRAQPETLRLRAITPGLTVGDVEKSLVFYVEGLGFTVKERWENEGMLQGAMLLAGDCELAIGQDNWAKGRDRVKGVGFRLYLDTVQDIDALAARAQAHGIAVDGPHDSSWGARLIGVTDPDGFNITFQRYTNR